MSSRQHGLLLRRCALPVFGTPGGPSSDATPAPRLLKFHAPEIVVGPGSLAEAGFATERLGAARPFVVTDPGLLATGWVGHPAMTTLGDACLSTNPRSADLHDVEALFLGAL